MIKKNSLLKHILGGLIIGLIIASVLKFSPEFRMEDDKVFKISLICGFTYIILNIIYGLTNFNLEGMENIGMYLPYSYIPNVQDEYYMDTGLVFDDTQPLNESLSGPSTISIPFGEVREIINDQRYNHPHLLSPDLSFKGPGYYLANDGEYSSDGISYDKASEIIMNSKGHDLYHQANHHIKWSPHTHVGKCRGYINWKPSVELE